MTERRKLLFWGQLTAVAVVVAHLLGVAASYATGELMRGASDLARLAFELRSEMRPWFNLVAFSLTTLAIATYVLPLFRFTARPPDEPASTVVRKRVIAGPVALAAITFAPWLGALLFFPAVTLAHFGRWSPELLSQEILSPLTSGFMASTTTYLAADWILRTRFVPVVFPDGVIDETPARSVGVTARLFVLAFAIGFTPMWTMLGLVAAAQSRVEMGVDAAGAVAELIRAVTWVFYIFIALGTGLALMLARSLTRPLVTTADALRRIGRGDLAARVAVESNDELGVLARGVNELASTLQDRERILGAFGRAVDPAIRDRLLRGDVRPGGETRTATILFADLRGFTAMAEREPAEELVASLNHYFDAMTAWVAECGGFVDKFVGDAMLVVFGLFADDPDARNEPGTGATTSAAAGVRCALGMRERLAALNRTRTAERKLPLSLGVGVHTGEVIAGTIGAADRHEYTVIGDAVNVAERLQELTRELGCDLVVSAHTASLARSAGLPPLTSSEREVVLRGRTAPIAVAVLD